MPSFNSGIISSIPGFQAPDEGTAIGKEECAAMIGSTKIVIAPQSDSHMFEDARRKELEGFMKNGKSNVVKRSSVPHCIRIFGTRFFDAYKTIEGNEIKKSRLVAQNYSDLEASSVSTKAPTVSRLRLPLTISFAACLQSFRSYFRDISQAYVQSESFLERKCFLHPPVEVKQGDNDIILAQKPLSGIPESVLDWSLTYQTYHKDALGMKATRVDQCVLYRRKESQLDDVTALQVDDSYKYGSYEFLEFEQRMCWFKSKPRKLLESEKDGVFNGVHISKGKGGIYNMTQAEKFNSLTFVTNADEFKRVVASVQYICNCIRPDICTAVQLLASNVSGPSDVQIKDLNSAVKHCISTSDTVLRFVPLDLASLRLVLVTDASFANAPELKSQLSFVVLIGDKDSRANILHYGSSRCKRVTRSVMAAEIHALVYGFENAYIARDIVSEILGRSVAVDAFIDSRTLFIVVPKNAGTLGKRLQIDFRALKQSHENGELRNLAGIPSKENISDAMTIPCTWTQHSLQSVMKENRFSVDVQKWARTFKECREEKNCECGSYE